MDESSEKIARGTPEGEQAYWTDQLAKCKGFLQEFHNRGEKVIARYLDERGVPGGGAGGDWYRARRFNLFYSNTEILKNSLYSSIPMPDVNRMHNDPLDDVSRVAAQIIQRGLYFELQAYPDFDLGVRDAIYDRLVPGLGVLWLAMREIDVGGGVKRDCAAIDSVYWRDFGYSPARTWARVQWVARREWLSHETFMARFRREPTSTGLKDQEKVHDQKCPVFEIWDKTTRRVYWVQEGDSTILDEREDPFGLKEFFPCPMPMIAVHSTKKWMPVAEYYEVKDQYDELDLINARIALLVDACKMVGVYDASQGNTLSNMFSSGENKMIPVDNWAMFAEKGGMKGVVDWYPIEVIVPVLNQLYAAREAVKVQIYEVTGMSDIIRGSTVASETATAQEIKAQFAGVRLTAYQRQVAYFVEELLTLRAQLMARFYDDEAWGMIMGTLSEPDQALIPQAMALIRDPVGFQYKIDVDVDSLTKADWEREKNQRMEFLGAIGNFIQQAVQAGSQSPQLAMLMAQMLQFGVAGFKAGKDLEGAIDQFIQQQAQAQQEAAQQPPPPPPPDPMQIQMQMEQQKLQLKQQEMQLKAQADMQQAQQEMQIAQQQAQQEMQIAQQKAANEMQIANAKAANEMQIARMKAGADVEAEAMELHTSMMGSMGGNGGTERMP